MNKEEIIEFYKQYSLFTFPGCYKEKLLELPDDIKEIGRIVRSSLIHRTILADGNIGTNADKKYGDMTKIPWYQQCQDDYLVTVSSMLTELYRKDERGLINDRKETDKLILTCRSTAILMASILKTKGIACRVRSIFTPYFIDYNNDDKSHDHWINQYWSEKENRWITIDVDGMDHKTDFDFFDIPSNKFDFPANAWLAVRRGVVDENHFHNASGHSGIYPILWELFYDFHCLMNNEIIYLHTPKLAIFNNPISKETKKEIDELAMLMQDPDKNFEALKQIWETKKEFRLLRGGLL